MRFGNRTGLNAGGRWFLSILRQPPPASGPQPPRKLSQPDSGHPAPQTLRKLSQSGIGHSAPQTRRKLSQPGSGHPAPQPARRLLDKKEHPYRTPFRTNDMGAPFIYPLISSGFVFVRNSTSFARIPLARSSLSSLSAFAAFSRTSLFPTRPGFTLPRTSAPFSPAPNTPGASHFQTHFRSQAPEYSVHPHPFPAPNTPEASHFHTHFRSRPPNTPFTCTLFPTPDTPKDLAFSYTFSQPAPDTPHFPSPNSPFRALSPRTAPPKHTPRKRFSDSPPPTLPHEQTPGPFNRPRLRSESPVPDLSTNTPPVLPSSNRHPPAHGTKHPRRCSARPFRPARRRKRGCPLPRRHPLCQTGSAPGNPIPGSESTNRDASADPSCESSPNRPGKQVRNRAAHRRWSAAGSRIPARSPDRYRRRYPRPRPFR